MTEGAPPGDERRPPLLPVLTAVVDGRWGRSVFGIVAPGAVRRRPSDMARVLVALATLGIAGARIDDPGPIERALVDLVATLPGGLVGVMSVLYVAGPVAAGALAVVALVARRPRLLGALVLAGALAWAVAAALGAVVDVGTITGTGRLAGPLDTAFPVVPPAVSAAVLFTALPFVTRPARRLLDLVGWSMALGALYLVEGLPSSVLASFALGWGAAALAHLAFGSPAGVPAVAQVAEALRQLGVDPPPLTLADEQTWGQTTFVADRTAAEAGGQAGLAVEVVGRDSTDARLFRKLWRFIWFKDSGPVLTLRRSAQVEHQALVLLLAARTEASVPDLVAVGTAGPRDDALLAVEDPPGRPLAELDPALVDADLLDRAWSGLGALHAAGLAHGNLTGRRLVVDGDGAVGLVRFDRAEASAPPDHLLLDDVQLLVATARVVGAARAVAAARRALGDDGLLERLPFLEPAAVTGRSRGRSADLKELLAALRDEATTVLGAEVPPPAELRRFSAGKVLLAAAFAFGVYLLVGQLVGVAEMGDVFAGAVLGWVALTALLAQLPPPAQAVAMTGSVATTLPLRPVAVVQYAQAFTGLVGGTAGNATLSIRFFQKQGLAPAVAVSSGVLNSLAGFVVQFVLVLTGLALTGDSFSGSDGGLPSWLAPAVAVAVLVAVGVAVLPGLRRRVLGVATRQLRQAYDNVRGIVSTPRKAVALFGGNLVSQVLFALVLGAALEAYGQSLPVLQLIVINSLASLVGGAVPVPGGMGVVETGLIAGFTAAGVPQAEATAATFTARMFTTYLPPIWGWIAFRWLLRHDYV